MKKYCLLAFPLVFSASTYAECDSGKVISTIMMEERTIIQRNHYQSQFFFPIDDAVVSRNTLWVRTYGADFSPVKIRKDGDSIELLNVQFALYLEGMSKDEESYKVKDYQGSRIFITPHFDKKCNFDGKVNLVAKKLDGSIVKGEFLVYKPFRIKLN
jgi:hypothetical protein